MVQNKPTTKSPLTEEKFRALLIKNYTLEFSKIDSNGRANWSLYNNDSMSSLGLQMAHAFGTINLLKNWAIVFDNTLYKLGDLSEIDCIDCTIESLIENRIINGFEIKNL